MLSAFSIDDPSTLSDPPQLELALLPNVDGVSVAFASGAYDVTFTGAELSNGDVLPLAAEECKPFFNASTSALAFPVEVTVGVVGVAGFLPTVVVVTTTAPAPGDIDG